MLRILFRQRRPPNPAYLIELANADLKFGGIQCAQPFLHNAIELSKDAAQRDPYAHGEGSRALHPQKNSLAPENTHGYKPRTQIKCNKTAPRDERLRQPRRFHPTQN